MKIFKKISLVLITAFPLIALADAPCSTGSGLCNPLGYTSLTTFLQSLLKLVAQIGFPVIVLYIVYIGFLFIAAEGKPDKLKEVRSNFFWAIIGALIVLGAYTLSLAIQATVGDLTKGV